MANVRRAVVTALMKQEKNGYSNLILKSALENFDGTKEERAFFTAVFYGTIERCFTIDHILQAFLQKPISKLDAQVRCILRSALYQAKYMQSVPNFAAINEAVTLTRKMGKSSAAGMVNAVLRKAVAYNIGADTFENEVQRVSVTYSVSPQIASVFLKELPDNYEQILLETFNANKMLICLRVNTLVTTIDEVERFFKQKNILTKRANSFVQNCLYVDFKGDITKTELFEKGAFHIQGEASQMVCALLAPKSGQKVADVCAAPGGKSATLAQYMGGKGELISADSAVNRLSLIESVLKRLNINCAKTLHNDASVYNTGKELDNCDCVLCDVPCTGLGIIAKKPDIRMKNLDEKDMVNLTELQLEILKTSANYVKNGGRLMYSTCTLNTAENYDIVRKFLAENKQFRLCTSERLAECLPISDAANNTATSQKNKGDNNGEHLCSYLPDNIKISENCITIYPSCSMPDGFFMALMEKCEM